MPPLKIQTTLIRPNGSKIDMGDGIDYHFKPNEQGHHVAEVDDTDHQQRLLSIPGYRLYDPERADIKDVTPPSATKKKAATKEPEGFEWPTTEAGTVDFEALAADVDLARDAYKEVFGRAPNAKAHPDTIVAKIRERMETKASAEGRTSAPAVIDEDGNVTDEGKTAIETKTDKDDDAAKTDEQ
ncbi:hypothetical protein [Maritimibacter sp. DP1N21-5]|uniref:hypothetical protein n=1 Tax=Maritimibacter sp. DP1N21-5 TaxID=2836867 RepID=UPI001C465ADB|nr:hypothetical protein [Maritimibacter sp. DP1N21-5]MBV7408764.1 hypothetical protein [Maritimibacter sp. DP1N21-5]